MNKPIPSIEAAVAPAGILPRSANHSQNQQDRGVFAQLLAAGETDARAQAPATPAAAGGKPLPQQPSEPAGDKAAIADAGTPVAMEPVTATPATEVINLPVAPELLSSPVNIDTPAAATQTEGAAQPQAAGAVPDALPLAGLAQSTPVVRDMRANAAQAQAQVQAQAVSDAAAQPPPVVAASAAIALPESAAVVRQGQPVDLPSATASADKVSPAVHNGVMKMLLAQQLQNDSQHAAAGERFLAAEAIAAGARTQQTAAADSMFAQTLAGTAQALPTAYVPVTVGQPGWGRAVGEQMMWFVSQNIKSASLRLNPQHLGPMEMHVQMDGDKATIAFSSQHAMVRDALESSLPRLREMFSANGLNLVNVDVMQHNGSGRDGGRFGAFQPPGTNGVASGAGADGIVPGAVMPELARAQGLVDYYV